MLDAAFVLNCTGPQSRFSGTEVPLFQNLLRRGLARLDELDLGLDVSEDFAVPDSEGNASRSLFATGPLLRGKLWETTAVPELRGQAMRIAQILLDHQAEAVVQDSKMTYSNTAFSRPVRRRSDIAAIPVRFRRIKI